MSRSSTLAALSALVGLATVAGLADAAPKKPKKPDSSEAQTAAEFDRQAAVAAITDVNLQKCKATNAAKGEGHVVITFVPAGAAENVKVDRGPWLGTPVAKCLTREFKKAKVPAFRGDPVTVGKSFRFE